MVNHLIQNKIATVKVLDTPSKWFGVTYALDRPVVVDKINALVAAGEYPAKMIKKMHLKFQVHFLYHHNLSFKYFPV